MICFSRVELELIKDAMATYKASMYDLGVDHWLVKYVCDDITDKVGEELNV